MSKAKKIGIAAGAVAVIAGASAGGYMLLNKSETSSGESTEAVASASTSSDTDVAPLASLSSVVPDDVHLYVEVPSIRALAQGSSKVKVMKVGLLDLLSTLDQVGAGVGKAFDLSAKDGSTLVQSFKSMAMAGRFDAAGPVAGAVITSDKPALVEQWLATKRFEKKGKVGDFDKYWLSAREEGDASDDMYTKVASGVSTPSGTAIVWVADKGLLAFGTDGFLKSVVDVSAGKGKPLSASADYQAEIKKLDAKPRMFAYAPASALSALGGGDPQMKATVDGFMKDAGALLVGIHMDAPGILMTVKGGVAGDKVPSLEVPAAPKLDLPGKLPADTAAYLAFSTKLDMAGAEAEKRLVEIVKTFDLSAAADLEKELANGRRHLGVGLSELIDAIGDQGVTGLVASKRELSMDQLDQLEINQDLAVIGLQALKNEAAMKKIVDTVKRVAPFGRSYTITATSDGGFEAKPKASEPFLTVRYPAGDLFYGIGAEDLVRKAYEAVRDGKTTLATEKAHTLALSGIPGSPHLTTWMDVSRTMRAPLTQPGMEALAPFLEKVVLEGNNRFTMTTSLGIADEGKGYRYRLDMLNSVGILPALGIYGVRRYLASSKTSEAKNTIGAIARAAAAAFEREQVGGGPHKLCFSARPVPGLVPAGTKYEPQVTPDVDFETGDEERGWKCLKFAMTQPHYFQYGYTAGGPYRGPAVGGPDPGKDGFEAWAVGDLDGDGETSLFTRTGTIDKATGQLKLSTEIFIHNEFE